MLTLHTTNAGASASGHDFASLSNMQGAPAMLFELPPPQQLSRPLPDYMTSIGFGDRRASLLLAWQANRLHQAASPRRRAATART